MAPKGCGETHDERRNGLGSRVPYRHVVVAAVLCGLMFGSLLTTSGSASAQESDQTAAADAETEQLERQQMERDHVGQSAPVPASPDSSLRFRSLMQTAGAPAGGGNVMKFAPVASTPVNVTEPVNFASTAMIWAPRQNSGSGSDSVSNLIRTTIAAEKSQAHGSPVARALLTATATDTEMAGRYVFNVYVNGTEVGVGPTRRAGNTLY